MSVSIGGGLLIYISRRVIDLGIEAMLTIEHFLLSLLAGLGVGLHFQNKTRKFLMIFLMALATACIDLDHLLPIYQDTGIKIFHNFFVFILIPFVLFLAFYAYEGRKNSSVGQRACLSLSVMFLGHMLLDGVFGTLPLFYPFRSEMFTISNIGITIDPTFFTLSSMHGIMIIWGAVIIGANMVETLIYNDVEGHEPSGLNLRRGRMPNKSRKSPLQAFINALPFVKM